MNRLPPAVLGLVIVNAIVFIAGMVGPHTESWLLEQGAFWYSANPNFELWQFVSYMFLHGGYGHILFNMLALVSFGSVLERQWGSRRFLIFYFLCGMGAALVHNSVNGYYFGTLHAQLIAKGMSPETINASLASGLSPFGLTAETEAILRHLYHIYAGPMLGASGAIYGVLVAFGLLYPNARLALMFVPVPIAAKFTIPALLALDLLSGVTGFSLFGGGVAHFAHLGGALIGFVLMLVWQKQTLRPGSTPINTPR